MFHFHEISKKNTGLVNDPLKSFEKGKESVNSALIAQVSFLQA